MSNSGLRCNSAYSGILGSGLNNRAENSHQPTRRLGAALGLAVLTTISLSAVNARLPGAATALQEGLAGNDAGALATAGEALSHGYTTGFLAGAGMLLIAAIIVIAAVTSRRRQGAVASAVA